MDAWEPKLPSVSGQLRLMGEGLKGDCWVGVATTDRKDGSLLWPPLQGGDDKDDEGGWASLVTPRVGITVDLLKSSVAGVSEVDMASLCAVVELMGGRERGSDTACSGTCAGSSGTRALRRASRRMPGYRFGAGDVEPLTPAASSAALRADRSRLLGYVS